MAIERDVMQIFYTVGHQMLTSDVSAVANLLVNLASVFLLSFQIFTVLRHFFGSTIN